MRKAGSPWIETVRGETTVEFHLTSDVKGRGFRKTLMRMPRPDRASVRKMARAEIPWHVAVSAKSHHWVLTIPGEKEPWKMAVLGDDRTTKEIVGEEPPGWRQKWMIGHFITVFATTSIPSKDSLRMLETAVAKEWASTRYWQTIGSLVEEAEKIRQILES